MPLTYLDGDEQGRGNFTTVKIPSGSIPKLWSVALASYNTHVTIGIAGFGFMGTTHLRGWRKIPHASVAALCTDTDKPLTGAGGNREVSASPLSLERMEIHRQWQALVDDPSIDIIDICLPSDLHAEVAVAALRNGKHVLCEKPMALDSADCGRMLEAASASGRILMIGHVLRWWPEYLALHRFVSDEASGRIRTATFIRQCALPDWSGWLTDETRSGGVLLDLLIHDIDQALSLFGLPARVNCKRFAGPETVMATLVYPDGPEVRIQGGWLAPGTPLSMSYQVRADRAELRFDSQGLHLSDGEGKRLNLEVTPADAYDDQIAYFLNCCRQNTQPSQCPPAASAEAIGVALLLKQSRDLGGQPLEYPA